MKKFILLIVCLYSVMLLRAQYNNEWINYSKTYYKCKVGQTGLHRISAEALTGLGLGSVPAEQFQLWRNGKQVALFTSAASGVLPAGGYIEFWGEMNDGTLDDKLYKNPSNHLNTTYSLSTDTSAYFLTTNNGANLRFTAAANDIQNNTVPAEPYFLYTYKSDFKQQINRGKGLYYGETIYSSTYDVGEFWSSYNIVDNALLDVTMTNLNVAVNGPAAMLSVSAAGNASGGDNRKLRVSVNNISYINQALPGYTAGLFTAGNIPLSALNSNTTKITIANQSSDNSAFDNLVAGMVHLTYPHSFNFGGAKTFAFNVAASGNGNYLEITNFNSGSGTPVLYDITNNKRYLANTATPNVLKFKIYGSSVDQALSLVLVSEDASNVTQLTAFAKKTFTDYGEAANQGDYLIISNAILLSGDNAVEQFRQYRASSAGGGFGAKIYDADELIDQFAWGVKKHPLGIKNFLQFARNAFSIKPRFVFIIGRGTAYDSYRVNESSPLADKLNLVPTFGWPASDAILASANFDPLAATPVGRLSVIKGSEVKDYLAKVKEYEQQQVSTTQTIDNKAWMKTVVNVTGANTSFEDAELSGYLNSYGNILRDTLFGGSVHSFNKTTTGEATPITDAQLTQLFNNGISIFNYFGHSSSTTLNYNLNDPQAYNNEGKYPFFVASGCDAGDFFGWDTTRFSVLSSIAEKYVLAPEHGSIAMLGSTNFGVGIYIHYYNTGFYKTFSTAGYNQNVGVSMAAGTSNLLAQKTSGDFDSTTKYLHAEQMILHGDPAIKINAFAKPDFAVEEPQIVINPGVVSVASNTFSVKAYLYNIGKATGDSVSVTMQRQYPDGTLETVLSKQIRAVRYNDSVSVELPVVASRDKGQNKMIVTVDNLNQYDEASESNNTATKTFLIYEDAITPIYPYNYSIVNRSNIKLAASTADPTLASRQYAMEIDTSALFTSSSKVSKIVTSLGGLVEWEPGVSFADSVVYYWRVAPVPAANENYRWTASSFVYLANASFGYNQSHLYQHLASATSRIHIDSTSRLWKYIDRQSTVQLSNSVFEVSGTLDGDFEVRVNGNIITQGACLGHSVIYNVFDPVTLKPLFNQATPSTVDAGGTHGGFMGSAQSCDPRHQGTQYNFEFSYLDTTSRRRMRDFMDWIKTGYLVTARIILNKVNNDFNQNPFAPDYKK